MKITWNELTINPDGLDFDALLAEWRWLVPNSMSPVVVSALGDLFLVDADGLVHWLDTGTGQLTRVADSAAQFKERMQQPENANEWFVPQLIGDLIEAGAVLQPGECYSCDVPLGLGGELRPENVKPTDILVHFSMAGQIFSQVHDLPPGTKIDKITFDDP
ncbi:MAG: T6SS immunity protein Tdi1 domain-containing protein [Planctomycetota bacterium]